MRPFGMSRDAQRKEILKRQAKELMAFDARLLQEEGELETGSKEWAKWQAYEGNNKVRSVKRDIAFCKDSRMIKL